MQHTPPSEAKMQHTPLTEAELVQLKELIKKGSIEIEFSDEDIVFWALYQDPEAVGTIGSIGEQVASVSIRGAIVVRPL